MNVIFDATFGAGLINAIKAVFKFHTLPQPVLCHLYEKFPDGVKDDVWIPQLLGDDWLIVTADLGRGRAPRLPAICRRHGKTHVLFSPGMIKAKQFEKARAIFYLWPDLVEAFSDKPGSRYQVEPERNPGRFKMVKKS